MKQRLSGVILVLALLLSSCGGQGSWQEQYDLGVRYLTEGNYEEAILAFTAAIEIDPVREESYVELANTYVLSGMYEEAENILRRGLTHMESETIQTLLAEIETILESASRITIINETPEWGSLHAYQIRSNKGGEVAPEVEIPSGGYIPFDNGYVSLQVQNIADGYRIASLLWNGEDYTSHLIYGAYGGFASMVSEDVELVFSMEPIPEVLPQFSGTVTIHEETISGERILRASTSGSSLPAGWVEYIWEYREPDSQEWTEILFWRGYDNCRVAPFADQLVDLAGTYVRVTAQGREFYANGSSTSQEYFVSE